MAASGGPPKDRRGGVAVRPGSGAGSARRPNAPAPRSGAGRPPAASSRPPGERHGPTRPAPSRPPGPGSPSSVSLTSAQRFAAKVRARRRRRILIALDLVAVLLLAVWVLLASSWATVKDVEVNGTNRLDPAVIRAVGEREAGQPLLLARIAQVRAEVARMPLVRTVTVTRHWPSSLRIEIVERRPVAAVPVAAQGDTLDAAAAAKKSGTKRPRAIGYRLVDADGVTVQTVDARSKLPGAMPVFEVDVRTTRGVAALRACLAVGQALPADLRTQVTAIGATSPDGIWLDLRSGARVQWGDQTQNELKSEVLKALLKQHAKAYDLRAPENPAVRT